MKTMTQNVAVLRREPEPRHDLFGLLAEFRAGAVQTRGLLEIVSLHCDRKEDHAAEFAVTSECLKLVGVPGYGTMLLRNASPDRRLIAPMHIGFFQHGAQNHATSRVLVLEADETLRATDCFCIQAAQGGLLQEAEQRFLMLPAGLRPAALRTRGREGFGRLWGEIDSYTRSFGVARGGHLERFLRPYFPRLLPFRHAFEPVAGQVGAAYFVAGELVGVEVGPNADYFADLFPILAIYCYGPSALLAERNKPPADRPRIDLTGLRDLDDLGRRLEEDRQAHARARAAQIGDLAKRRWKGRVEEERCGLRVSTISDDGWIGQTVRDSQCLRYLSVFRTPA